jgi:hypothetical protein
LNYWEWASNTSLPPSAQRLISIIHGKSSEFSMKLIDWFEGPDQVLYYRDWRDEINGWRENVSLSASNAVPDWSVKCNRMVTTLPKGKYRYFCSPSTGINMVSSVCSQCHRLTKLLLELGRPIATILARSFCSELYYWPPFNEILCFDRKSAKALRN